MADRLEAAAAHVGPVPVHPNGQGADALGVLTKLIPAAISQLTRHVIQVESDGFVKVLPVPGFEDLLITVR